MMKKLLAALLFGLLASGASAQTIDNLNAGAALTGAELFPMFQTADPAVNTPLSAIKTFINKPAGSSGQVQFNSGGTTFGADAGLVYTSQGQLAIVNGTANTTPLTISGGSATGSSIPKLGVNISNTINSSAVGDGIDLFANTTATQNPVGSLLVDLQVGSASKFTVDTAGNESLAGSLTTQGLASFGNMTFSTNTAGLVWTGRGAITSEFSQNINLGGSDSASPSAQFLTVGSVAAGNGNVAGVNWTITGSRSNGSGASGDIIFQTGGTGAGSGSENAAVTAITFKGVNQNIVLGAGVATGTNADFLCLAAGGIVTLQTSACTISSARFKQNIEPLRDDALAELGKIDVISFNMKPQAEPNRDNNFLRTQIGVTAENVAAVDKRLAIYEQDGVTPKSYRQESMIALELAAIKQLASRMKTLEARR